MKMLYTFGHLSDAIGARFDDPVLMYEICDGRIVTVTDYAGGKEPDATFPEEVVSDDSKTWKLLVEIFHGRSFIIRTGTGGDNVHTREWAITMQA